jgi:saccharopine dehydrogenase (NAD+, L-lysine-forming)
MTALWLRCEVRDTERRSPISPAAARALIAQGVQLTVERSEHRCFAIEEYRQAGCAIADAGSWPDAPDGTVVVGLKELPERPAALRHRHVYFAHAYKRQAGAARLLARFAAGGGQLLDLEYLVDDGGRRLAAFGYWAGYLGAALAVLQYRRSLEAPLTATTRDELAARLRKGAQQPAQPSALVIGALGRSGRGACDALRMAGIEPTRWDLPQTQNLDRSQLLAHDLLINTVLVTEPSKPFLTDADLEPRHDRDRRLSLICDVSCDVDSPFNVLPIYDQVTSWQQPVSRLTEGSRPLSLIAIDNLPALLPVEASLDFSAALSPFLADLGGPAWQRCYQRFLSACHSYQLDGEAAHA